MSQDRKPDSESQATRLPPGASDAPGSSAPATVVPPAGPDSVAPGASQGASRAADPQSYASASPFDLVGQTLGPYRMVAQLGAGGMGAVYLAEQHEPVHRQVAIKVIKAGMDSEELLARFALERQLLARMNHPHVAQVLDAGATDHGRMYFVMEHVPGVPLVDYCDNRGLDLDHRLGLFLQVCDGVQHAHQNGVIHRDLKPSNLLAADYQGRSVVKVIDFGIAKSMDEYGSASPAHTRIGTPIGTPSYMSPEQAEGGAIGVDTRTDVYALGVVLYQLVTEELPIDSDTLAKASQHDLPMTIRAAYIVPPSKLVMTLAKLDSSEWKRRMASDYAAHARRMRGDLDWIVLKAMERERELRYSSVSELAADIKRFLNGEPVLACPPSRAYLVRKFVQRNRLAVAAAAAVVAALVLGIFGTSWMAVEARRARVAAEAARVDAEMSRDQAKAESARAKAIRRLLENTIARPDPWGLKQSSGVVRDVKLVEVLEESEPLITDESAGSEALRAEFATLLGRTWRGLGDVERARRLLVGAAESVAKVLPENAPERLETELELAMVLADSGKLKEAKAAFDAVLPKLASGLIVDPMRINDAQRTNAQVLGGLGEIGPAVERMRALLKLKEVSTDADSTEADLGRAELAELLGQRGDWEEAEALLKTVYENQSKALGPSHPVVLHLLGLKANLAYRKGDYPLAEQRYREAVISAERILGPEHPNTLTYSAQVANTLATAGRADEAVPMFEKVIEVRRRVLGEAHPSVTMAQSNLANAYRTLKRYDEAQVAFQSVYDRLKAEHGEAHPETIRALAALAVLAKDRNDLPTAEVLLKQCAELYAETNGENHPETLVMENNYLAVVSQRGDYARAIVGYQDLLFRAEKHMPADLWHLGAIRGLYGKALYLEKRYAEAEPLILASYRQMLAQFPETDRRVIGARTRVEELYQLWGKPEKAKEVLAEKPASGS